MEKVELTEKEIDTLIEGVTLWEHRLPTTEEILEHIQAMKVGGTPEQVSAAIQKKTLEISEKIKEQRKNQVEYGTLLKAKLIKLKDKTAVSDVIHLGAPPAKKE